MTSTLIDELAADASSKRVRAAAKRIGRPTKLTKPLAEKIIEYVMVGLGREQACEAVGISGSTLRRWLARAAEFDDADAEEVPESERLWFDFCRLLKLAESRAELDLLLRVREAGYGWQAYMTILERRWPRRWGRSDKRLVEHSGKTKVDVELTMPDDERRREVAKILDEAEALHKEEQSA